MTVSFFIRSIFSLEEQVSSYVRRFPDYGIGFSGYVRGFPNYGSGFLTRVYQSIKDYICISKGLTSHFPDAEDQG